MGKDEVIMEYQYVRVYADKVNETLVSMVVQGWRVHTFNRNPDSSVVDILFERETQGGYE